MENNNSEFRTLRRVLAALSFLIIFIVLAISAQPSVPFWDCGERLAMMTWQQICHPPGAPLFAIIGGVVNVLVPFGNLGLHGNMISVTASAVSVMFLFLIASLVIKNLREDPIETLTDALAVYGAAFVGALSFGLCATVWFNGTESEVYSTAILIVSIVIYLLMKWTTVADEPHNERYLLVCVYLTALSMGVHFLGTLVLFTIILVVYFRKYEVTPKTFFVMVLIGIASYVIVLDMIAQGLPAYLAGHTTTRNAAMEFTIQNSNAIQVITLLLILGLAYLFYTSYSKKKWSVAALFSFSLLMVIFSFSIYAHVYIRSHANPPMNENSPKTLSVLASYIRREQYGTAPMWPRRYQTEDYFERNFNKQDDKGNYVYGLWNPPTHDIVSRSDGSRVYATNWNNINTSGELSYMWKYQMSHMYFRYFGWNFIGRMSNVQDEGVAMFESKDSRAAKEANYATGNEGVFPIRYFALPFLFGLIGLYYNFKRNPKSAFTFLCTFLVFGVVLAMYQNQQEPQPRERDYFYAGSFLIWGLWIAVGTYALIDMLGKKRNAIALTSVILIASFLLVPMNMLYSNFPAYSRNGKWLTFDYAYNVLQSLEQDAILFTNGDNDTFCVWYMQDVEGVRRDVRVCNLSLGQTLWYVEQLKNREPWGAKKLPISIPDENLLVEDEGDEQAFSYERGPAKTDRIKISKDILAKYTNDLSIIDRGEIDMTFIGSRELDKDAKGNITYFHGVNDRLVRDIVVNNKFERPLYFISSAGSGAMCGLDEYTRVEGLARRVCPVKQSTTNGNDAYNEEIMDQILLSVDNSDSITKTPKFGLKLRNLANPTVTYDETDRRTVLMSYPNMFIGYANYLADVKKDFKRAEQVIDTYLQHIPLARFPLGVDAEFRIANIYKLTGNTEKMKLIALKGIKTCEEQIANNNLEPQSIYYEQIGRYYGPYQYASEMYKMVGQWEKAQSVLQKLAASMQTYLSQWGNSQEAQRLAGRLDAVKNTADQVIIDRYEAEGNLQQALEEAKKLETKLANDTKNPYSVYFIGTVTQRKNEIEEKLGLPQSGTPILPQIATETTTDSIVTQNKQ